MEQIKEQEETQSLGKQEKLGKIELETQEKTSEKIGQNEVYNLLTSDEVSWKAIIYDLINTEQLDPWNINLAFLANKYLEKIKQLEEANFFISSKVLLAASILLRIKSESLLNKYIKSIDDILFGKKEEEKKEVEKIEFDESEISELSPKTPLPRYRKVTLQELMSALDKAMSTEQRRIRREVEDKTRLREAEIMIPKKRINIKDRIRKIYSQILTSFKKKQTKISYSDLTGNKKEEKLACFLPCLHLDNQHKLFLEQEKHLDEIYIWLYKHYQKEQLKMEVDFEKELLEEEKLAEETGFDNPLANFSDVMSEIMKSSF